MNNLHTFNHMNVLILWHPLVLLLVILSHLVASAYFIKHTRSIYQDNTVTFYPQCWCYCDTHWHYSRSFGATWHIYGCRYSYPGQNTTPPCKVASAYSVILAAFLVDCLFRGHPHCMNVLFMWKSCIIYWTDVRDTWHPAFKVKLSMPLNSKLWHIISYTYNSLMW